MEEGRGMLEGGTTTVTPSNVCAHVNGWRWHSIAILNRECVLMLMLGGGATIISTLKCVCAHVNAWRWHSDNLHLELCVYAYVNAYPHLKRMCSCQCLEVAQPQSPCILEP